MGYVMSIKENLPLITRNTKPHIGLTSMKDYSLNKAWLDPKPKIVIPIKVGGNK